MLVYQPSIGPFGSLNGNVLNPISTASGALGGEVLGLEFNVDFKNQAVLHTLRDQARNNYSLYRAVGSTP